MKCVDCRKPVSHRSKGRPDICEGCWELRLTTMALVTSGAMPIATFKEIQSGMAKGYGQRAMLQAINHDLYEI